MNNNVLIIAHDYPPFAGGGVMRIHKFVRYFPEYNIVPVVLTINEKYYQSIDESLLNEYLQPPDIHRTMTIDLKKIYLYFKKRKNKIQTSEIIGIESSSKFSKICEWIASLIFIPDYKILWLPFALSKALQLIDQKKIKNIITTAPPHSTNIIGLLIKLILPEIRWIADFRDTWTENEVYNYPLKIIKKIEEFLELKTLQYADYIVCTTDSVKNSFVEKYKLSESKFKVITNGFDEADFNFSDKKIYIQPETKILNIVYSGSLNDWRNLSNFCGALKKLEIEKKIDLTKLHIQLCGHIPAFEHRRIKKLKLQNVFEFINLEPHKESIKRLIAADLLLLIIGEKEGTVVLTGKLFEYIGAARPIFAVVPKNGEAEKLITQNNFGIVADTSSLDDISEKFLKIYNLFFENNAELNFNRNIEIRKKFTRKLLTKKIADIINAK